DDPRRADRACALLSLVGVVNVPIVHFSVKWWNTLHQGSTVRLLGPSAIDSSMLWPLLVMALATKLWFFASLFVRARNDLVELEAGKDWARKVALGEGDGA
ncbi:MAG: heme ABC transporter permease, partial [Dokdonella sp.]|nr:heme ABC transporter permease [Dokdonella sp.]